jgi:hypothetical protein
MISSLLPCEKIYSKEYRHGTLFGLMFLKQTYVTDMHAQMIELDKELRHDGPTKFTSICDILSGKIKSFGKNKRETLVDEHFNVIFKPLSGKKMQPQDGVNVWINPSIPNQGVQVPTAANEGVQVPTAEDEDEDDSEDEASDAQDAGQKRASESGGAPPSKRTKTTLEDEEEEEEEFDPSVTVNYGFNGEVRGTTRIITDLRDSRVCLPDGSPRPAPPVAPMRTKPPAVEATKAELRMENTGLKLKLAEIMEERVKLYKENDGLTDDKKILERQLKEQKEQMETMEAQV